MGKEFKPGDLAMIVNATIPENIGKCVELVYVTRESGVVMPINGINYVLDNKHGGEHWLVSGNLRLARILGGELLTTDVGMVPTAWLMPLRGDENPDATLVAENPHEVVTA